jgi:hypothetical protein
MKPRLRSLPFPHLLSAPVLFKRFILSCPLIIPLIPLSADYIHNSQLTRFATHTLPNHHQIKMPLPFSPLRAMASIRCAAFQIPPTHTIRTLYFCGPKHPNAERLPQHYLRGPSAERGAYFIGDLVKKYSEPSTWTTKTETEVTACSDCARSVEEWKVQVKRTETDLTFPSAPVVVDMKGERKEEEGVKAIRMADGDWKI